MDAELALTQLKVQWDGLNENVADKYAKGLEDVLAQFGERITAEYLIDERREEREALRHKLDRIGDVNLTAIEEFEEISERHSFLSNQEADLIQALDNLEVTIHKINTAYRRSFKKTFELASTVTSPFKGAIEATAVSTSSLALVQSDISKTTDVTMPSMASTVVCISILFSSQAASTELTLIHSVSKRYSPMSVMLPSFPVTSSLYHLWFEVLRKTLA